MTDLPSPAALALAPAGQPGAAALAASIERVSVALRELGDTVHALQRGAFWRVVSTRTVSRERAGRRRDARAEGGGTHARAHRHCRGGIGAH